jgi:hypothetical protein
VNGAVEVEAETVLEDGELADSELEQVSGGMTSSVLKKRDDATNAVIGKM